MPASIVLGASKPAWAAGATISEDVNAASEAKRRISGAMSILVLRVRILRYAHPVSTQEHEGSSHPRDGPGNTQARAVVIVSRAYPVIPWQDGPSPVCSFVSSVVYRRQCAARRPWPTGCAVFVLVAGYFGCHLPSEPHSKTAVIQCVSPSDPVKDTIKVACSPSPAVLPSL